MQVSKSAAWVPRCPYVCTTCYRRLRPAGAIIQKRTISKAYIQKTEDANLQWAQKAAEIKAGKEESMLTMLERRGYVNQIVGDRDALDQLMTEKRVGIYVGIDPTAASMHIGHLLPLMVLYWAYIKGYKTCSLLGGATAQIGDPIGRTAAREQLHSTDRKVHMTMIHYQLKSLWQNAEDRARSYGYNWEWSWRREIANNNAWLNKLPLMDLLKLLGRGVRLGTMLGRDTVKNRMGPGEGMSFAEFTYPLLQSWDWWYMYDTKDIQVQVGGADQFGNILAGIDSINHIRHTHPSPEIRQDEKRMTQQDALLKRPMGFTVPLLTTKSGEKFGKSAGNAIWLDREMTSAFDLYQFFLRMADADVHRYLKLFTFESLDVLEDLMVEHQKDPSKRVAQHKLAREVLEIVHGHDTATRTEEEHRSLFRRAPAPGQQSTMANGDGSTFTNEAVSIKPKNAPTSSIVLPQSLVLNQPIARIVYHAGLVASRNEGQRTVNNGGVYLGSRPSAVGTMGDQVDFSPAGNWNGSETKKFVIGGDTLIMRIGKWKVKIIKIISDEAFESQGRTAPGWKGKHEDPLSDGEPSPAASLHPES